MSAPFGISPWGLGAWGSAGPLYVVSAIATTTHTVRVTLSVRPRAVAPTAPGDAYNPETWYVTSDDLTITRTVLTVSRISNKVFDLYLLQDLGNVRSTWRVGSDVLLSASDTLITPPSYVTFRGVEISDAARRPVLVPRDLANNQAAQSVANGTLQPSSAGGYATQSGVELLKKLIWRRITTTPGGFFHLGESYGTELKLKQFARENDLIAMRAKLEQQIREEPDVDAVAVELSLSGSGVLQVRARVQSARLGNGTATFTARS